MSAEAALSHNQFPAQEACPSCKGKKTMFNFHDFKRWQGLVPDDVALNHATEECDTCLGTGRDITEQEWDDIDRRRQRIQ